MKLVYNYIVTLLLFLVLVGCSSLKENHKAIPFVLKKAIYYDWAETKNASKGIKIRIEILPTQTKFEKGKIRTIEFTPIFQKEKDAWILEETFFYTLKKENKILHRDAKKEYGNRAPVMNDSIQNKDRKETIWLHYMYHKEKDSLLVELQRVERSTLD